MTVLNDRGEAGIVVSERDGVADTTAGEVRAPYTLSDGRAVTFDSEHMDFLPVGWESIGWVDDRGMLLRLDDVNIFRAEGEAAYLMSDGHESMTVSAVLWEEE